MPKTPGAETNYRGMISILNGVDKHLKTYGAGGMYSDKNINNALPRLIDSYITNSVMQYVDNKYESDRVKIKQYLNKYMPTATNSHLPLSNEEKTRFRDWLDRILNILTFGLYSCNDCMDKHLNLHVTTYSAGNEIAELIIDATGFAKNTWIIQGKDDNPNPVTLYEMIKVLERKQNGGKLRTARGFDAMTVKELRTRCSNKGIVCSRLKKADLIAALRRR